ncbi:hypothetical protein SK128_006136, partial [Halocaridina rubra]
KKRLLLALLWRLIFIDISYRNDVVLALRDQKYPLLYHDIYRFKTLFSTPQLRVLSVACIEQECLSTFIDAAKA